MQLEAKNIGFRYGNGPWLFQGINLTSRTRGNRWAYGTKWTW